MHNGIQNLVLVKAVQASVCRFGIGIELSGFGIEKRPIPGSWDFFGIGHQAGFSSYRGDNWPNFAINRAITSKNHPLTKLIQYNKETYNFYHF